MQNFKLFLALFLFLTTFELYANSDDKVMVIFPEWYLNQSLSKKEYEIYGYGDGKNLQEATSRAKNAIAQNIKTVIQSKYTSLRTSSGEKFDNDVSLLINEEANAELFDLEMFKSEVIDGHYFVVLKYENLTLDQKLKKYIAKFGCITTDSFEYIHTTDLYARIVTETHCKAKISLSRRNNIWYIKYQNKLIPLDRDEMIGLFTSKKSDDFYISPTKREVKAGELFFINIYGAESGYFSLFNITQDGEVTKLLENTKIAKKEDIYPNPKEYDGLEAYTKSKQSTFDLYLATSCKEERDFSKFGSISTQKSKNIDKMSLLFDRLIEKSSGCKITSFVLRIRG